MEPDLDQLRLQQLLQPFNNQRGVISTNSAIPMINSIPMINTGMIDKNLQNTDLVQQIIAENQRKTNPFVRPNMLDIAGGVVPGGIPTASSVTPSIIPENLLYEDFNYKYLPSANDQYESEATTTPQTKKDGIAGLLKFLVGLAVPGAGFLMNLPGKGLEGIRSLNQRIQGSDFGQATSLMDYLDMRKYGGLQGRRDAAARTMAQARGIQKKIDTGKYRRTAADNVIDRGRGDRPGGANYTAPSKPSRTSPQSGMQAERTRSRDLGSMRGGVGR